MKEQFRQYIINLYHDIPQEVYEGLLSIFCIGLVVFIAWKGFKTGLRYSAPLLLAYSDDTRSPIPMISVHLVGNLQYRRQS